MRRSAHSMFQFKGLVRLRSLRGGVISAGAWTISAKVVSQISQVAAFILAARSLPTAEFGFYAYSSAFVLLFVAIAEGGWGEFIMKTPDYRKSLSQIATVALISGSGVTLIGLLATTVIQIDFKRTDEATIIALYSCWILPAALSTVYDGVMVADGKLRNLALIRISGEIAGLATVALGLSLGWGVVSFVASRLAAQLVCLFASMVVVRWLPRLELTRAFCKELLEFSRHIVANRFIVLFRSYSATLLIGSFLGLTDAGFYRAAERIVAAVSELVGEPARILAWSRLRRVAPVIEGQPAAKEDIGKPATMLLSVLMIIAMPVYVGLALVAEPLVRLVLGPSWAPTAALLILLALKQILLIPGYVTEPILSLTGNIRRMPPNILVNNLVGVVILLSLAPFGMLPAAVGQCVAAIFAFAISIYLHVKYGGVQWLRVLRDCSFPALGLTAMSMVVLGVSDLTQLFSIGVFLTMALQILSGAAIYLAALVAGYKLGAVIVPDIGFGRSTKVP